MVGEVERWKGKGRFFTRHDFLGFADLLAVPSGSQQIIALQPTTKNGLYAHKRKLRGLDPKDEHAEWRKNNLKQWLENGHLCFIEAWYQDKKTKLWTLKSYEMTLEDLCQ